jgi:hypothetical protein
MVNAAVVVSASLLVIGITVAAFMVLKAQYDAKKGAYNTVGEICDDLAGTIEPTSEVAKLCLDFGSDGADVGLDDPIICSPEAKDETFEYLGEVEDYTGALFTMREILEADDVQAKYDEVEIRCNAGRRTLAVDDVSLRGSAVGARELFVAYGWCSTNWGMAFGQDDANYCDTNSGESSWGRGTAISSCCIRHDKCLQTDCAEDPFCNKGDCGVRNCKGGTCDNRLRDCVWGVKCSYKYKCGWWKCWGYSAECGSVSTAIAGIMHGNPNGGRFTGADDSNCA